MTHRQDPKLPRPDPGATLIVLAIVVVVIVPLVYLVLTGKF